MEVPAFFPCFAPGIRTRRTEQPHLEETWQLKPDPKALVVTAK